MKVVGGITVVTALIAASLIGSFILKFWPLNGEASCIGRMLIAPVVACSAGLPLLMRPPSKRFYCILLLLSVVAGIALCGYVIAFMMWALRAWPEFCICGC
jgi:hypothetical protein